MFKNEKIKAEVGIIYLLLINAVSDNLFYVVNYRVHFVVVLPFHPVYGFASLQHFVVVLEADPMLLVDRAGTVNEVHDLALVGLDIDRVSYCLAAADQLPVHIDRDTVHVVNN